VVAYGWTAGARYWIEVPEVATFGLLPGDQEILCHASGGADTVEDAFWTLAVPLALQLNGLEVLHASGIRTSTGVVGFCGFSGTGKTTTAYGLARRGYALWADDAVVMEPTTGGPILAHPLPFRFNLRAQTRDAFGLGDATAPAGEATGPAPLAALVVLERVEDPSQASVERLDPKTALPALLPHSFRFDLTDLELRRATVGRYLAIVAAVPVVRARFVPSFATLDRLLDDLESAIAGG
jgi:hypothetical protein